MEISEFIHGASLKLLRWDKNSPPANHTGGILDQAGIIMFCVKDKVQLLRTSSATRYHDQQQINEAGYSQKTNGVNYPPLLITLNLRFPNLPFNESSIQGMFFNAIASIDFFHQNNHRYLAKILTERLLKSFSFDDCTMQPFVSPTKRFKLVVVVDVDRKFVHVMPKPTVLPNLCDLYPALSRLAINHEEAEREREVEEMAIELFSEDKEIPNSELWDIWETLKCVKLPSFNYRRRPMIGKSTAPLELSQVMTKAMEVMIKSKEEDKCSICWEGFSKENGSITVLHCKHAFHKVCISQWLSRHRTCPYCRAKCNPS